MRNTTATAVLPSSLTQITHHHDISSSLSSSSSPIIVSPMEAESIISSIRQFSISEIGSSSFLKLFGFQIEKLSLQAHASASSSASSAKIAALSTSIGGGGEDEYVMDLLLTHDKVTPLVQTLLAIEAWRIFVLGGLSGQTKDSELLSEGDESNENDDDDDDGTITGHTQKMTFLERIAKGGNSLRVAFILHVETTIVSLLTLLFYRKENVMEIENSTLLSIVDYCARQMSSLAAPLSNNDMVYHQKHPRTIDQMVSSSLSSKKTALDDINYNRLQTEYKTAVKTTSLARYICEHFDSLSISIQSRILNTHDFLMLFIPLIDEPPWTRRRSKCSRLKSRKMTALDEEVEEEVSTVWEKYINQEWNEIPSCDLLQMTQCEAQCWIAVFHLTCGNEHCREQYGLNTYRKEQILRLRKFLNEYLMDQLPVLVDVTRYMDELSLMYVPESSNVGSVDGKGMAVLMEQIDRIRESILKECNCDWDQVAIDQMDRIYSKVTDGTDEDLRLIATIFNEEHYDFGFEGSSSTSEPSAVDPVVTAPQMKQLKAINIRVCKKDDDNEDGNEEVKRDFLDVFNLCPNEDDEGIIVQTPYGPFRRKKLVIEQTGDFMQLYSSSRQRLDIEANLSFHGVVGIQQFITDLILPDVNNVTKRVEWVQLGKLENELVLQLGFKCDVDDTNRAYMLVQAFIAQPSEDKSV